MNDNVHRIRLDAQWVLKPVVRFSLPSEQNSIAAAISDAEWGEPVKLKTIGDFESSGWAESLTAESPKGFLLERYFNCPTGLDSDQSVVLAFEFQSADSIWMNDVRLDLSQAEKLDPENVEGDGDWRLARVQIHERLEKQNVLLVVSSSDQQPIRNVAIEIMDG